jgi:alkanesulfonate monooxygenase SsuD/methylene tetrahydromethanopterin reductase-like flavin-dependent oxidoreductase (luciferase family)
MKGNAPVTFSGTYYQLRGATLLPKTQRKGGPKVLIGGKGGERTLSAVVQYADEWNSTFSTAADFTKYNARLTEKLAIAGRDLKSVRRSMMVGCIFGKDEAALNEKINNRKTTLEKLQERGFIVGDTETVKEQLKRLEEAGLQRIMLQWLDLDDIDGLEALAQAVL